MACNCKASKYIRNVQETFGYDKKPKVKSHFKLTFMTVCFWILIIIFVPFFILIPFFYLFKKDKKIKLFNSITVRL